jgi:hypothetical protein
MTMAELADRADKWQSLFLTRIIWEHWLESLCKQLLVNLFQFFNIVDVKVFNMCPIANESLHVVNCFFLWIV